MLANVSLGKPAVVPGGKRSGDGRCLGGTAGGVCLLRRERRARLGGNEVKQAKELSASSLAIKGAPAHLEQDAVLTLKRPRTTRLTNRAARTCTGVSLIHAHANSASRAGPSTITFTALMAGKR